MSSLFMRRNKNMNGDPNQATLSSPTRDGCLNKQYSKASLFNHNTSPDKLNWERSQCQQLLKASQSQVSISNPNLITQ